MHPFALVPLGAAAGAGALASAIGFRQPPSEANRPLALLMGVNGLWCLASVGWLTAADADSALLYMRLGAIPALAVAPLAFHLILALRPALVERYRGPLRFCYAIALALAVLWLVTPLFVPEMVRTSWGWAPRLGFAAFVSCLLLVSGPLLALASSRRLAGGEPPEERRFSDWLHASIAVPFGLSFVCDLLLPALGVHLPPVGGVSIFAWGLCVWWGAYRFGYGPLAPQRFAREILETLPDAIVLLRPDGRIRNASGRLAEWVGCTGRELPGRRLDELLVELPAGVPADGQVERELLSRSGERIPVSTTRNRLHDAQGDPLGWVVTIRDLRQVVSLRSRLVMAGRLAAVGQLAAGIAHEINNPVAYVRVNLGLLQSEWRSALERLEKLADGRPPDVGREGPEIIAESREGVDRVVGIVRDVGGFAEPGTSSLESADLNELLDTAVRVATSQLRPVRLERCYQPLPRVRCVTGELMQVFLNLVLNAAQAVRENGSVRLVTRALDDRVEVRVEDDGPGVPPQLADRIFEPFFTTKPEGEGTGLGLSISRHLVRKHLGEIGVRAREGGGSVFWATLPVGEPADAWPAD